MKTKNDNNVTKNNVTTLTPFEKHAENARNNARIMHETSAIIEKLGELKGLIDDESETEGEVFDTLSTIADEALIGLALELENKYGISA